MKRLLLLFIIMPICLFAQNKDSLIIPEKGSLSYMDYKYGFKDIHLGQDVNTIDVPIKFTDSSESKSFYSILDNKYYAVGDCVFSDIFFTAFNGKVCEIFISTKGYTNSSCILSIIENLFGSGFSPNEFTKQRAWSGTKCICIYNENSITHDADISITSIEISKLYKEYRAIKISKSSSGF